MSKSDTVIEGLSAIGAAKSLEMTRWPGNETGPHLDCMISDNPIRQNACEQIIEVCREFDTALPTIVGEEYYPAHRKAVMRKIGLTETSAPLLGFLVDLARDVNEKAFQFELSSISRSPQYVEYVPENGHFDWHNDYSHALDPAPRKITMIIQLSAPEAYKGGELQLFGNTMVTMPKELGTVIAFPSIFYHRVRPVTHGKRSALVCWVGGERLK